MNCPIPDKAFLDSLCHLSDDEIERERNRFADPGYQYTYGQRGVGRANLKDPSVTFFCNHYAPASKKCPWRNVCPHRVDFRPIGRRVGQGPWEVDLKEMRGRITAHNHPPRFQPRHHIGSRRTQQQGRGGGHQVSRDMLKSDPSSSRESSLSPAPPDDSDQRHHQPNAGMSANTEANARELAGQQLKVQDELTKTKQALSQLQWEHETLQSAVASCQRDKEQMGSACAALASALQSANTKIARQKQQCENLKVALEEETLKNLEQEDTIRDLSARLKKEEKVQ
ncbi:hypothetical protein IAU59_007061 [Kwoniella sp. CBS 9459]